MWQGGRRLLSTSSFLLDISSEYINVKSLKNQSDLARALKSRFSSALAFEAFESIDRALFLSTSDLVYREPYSNIPQPFGVGNANMSTPIHHALVLDTLHIHADLKPGSRVLDVGCGSGYLAAALFKTVNGNNGRVVAVDRIPELVSLARKCLQDCPITTNSANISVLDAYTKDGDWNLQAMDTCGPFDAIHVGFSFNPETDQKDLEMLCNMLDKSKHTSRVLAGWGDELCLFDSKGYRKEVATLPGLARKETGTFVKPISRTERMELAKAKLDAWKQQFEAQNQRKPSKTDLLTDPVASALFKEFSAGSGWRPQKP